MKKYYHSLFILSVFSCGNVSSGKHGWSVDSLNDTVHSEIVQAITSESIDPYTTWRMATVTLNGEYLFYPCNGEIPAITVTKDQISYVVGQSANAYGIRQMIAHGKDDYTFVISEGGVSDTISLRIAEGRGYWTLPFLIKENFLFVPDSKLQSYTVHRQPCHECFTEEECNEDSASPKAYDIVCYEGYRDDDYIKLAFADGYPNASEIIVTDGETGQVFIFSPDDNDSGRFHHYGSPDESRLEDFFILNMPTGATSDKNPEEVAGEYNSLVGPLEWKKQEVKLTKIEGVENE